MHRVLLHLTQLCQRCTSRPDRSRLSFNPAGQSDWFLVENISVSVLTIVETMTKSINSGRIENLLNQHLNNHGTKYSPLKPGLKEFFQLAAERPSATLHLVNGA